MMNPKTFQCDYPGIDSVYENIVRPVFGVTDRLNEDVIKNNGLRANANEAKIGKITRIAEYSLDGNPFNIFDVELLDKVELSRNRIAIKKLLVSQVDVFSSSLIFFHYANPQGKEWRISYFAKGRGNMDTTSPRRYTFLCGKTHGCRTIAERFEHLKNQSEKTRALLTEVFSVEALNKEFYQKLANWFFWALSVVRFPEGKDDSKKNAVPLIRLITRLMFVWFMRKKGLVPDKLFQKRFVDSILKPGCDESAYYKAILQNLFFATLNTEQTDREARKFRMQERHNGRNEQFQIHSVYRYEDFFSDKGKKDFLDLMQNIPFLNGGLFSCLDDAKNPVDAFSDRTAWRDMLYVPDVLFWTTEEDRVRVNLNSEYGDKLHSRESVLGLITLLDQYNFTIDENSRDEATIALDPELLGIVFENLLASYNPETSTTARKQTGSFYTPREIVDYMVEESLIRYLLSKNIADVSEEQFRALVTDESLPNFDRAQKKAVIEAIENCKILDPACGSGAFPMGLLHNLVRIQEKVKPASKSGKSRERKLRIIQNCIYGVDIQPIAVQIAKLRCFISLLADCEVDDKSPNRGIEPLPNLEMHFVAANSLVDVKEADSDSMLSSRTAKIKGLMQDAAQKLFSVKNRADKKKLQKKYLDLRKDFADSLCSDFDTYDYDKIAEWDPFDQMASSPFFNPQWMFGIENGFDIVIGNPPYVRADNPDPDYCREREAIKSSGMYETLYEKWDLFIPFLERGYRMLNDGGVETFIVSDAYCHAKYAKKSQEWFLSHARIPRIDFCGDLKIFEAAVHNVILFFENADGTDNAPLRRLHTEKFGNVAELPSNVQRNLTYRTFFPENGQARTSLSGIPLGLICYISKGMVVHANERICQGAFEMSDLESDTRDEIHSRRFVEGKHLDTWRPSMHKYLEWGTNRAPSLFSRPTFPELYEHDKILVQRSPGPDPKACIDTDNILYNESSVGFILWHELSGVKNGSLKKSARYQDETPKRDDLPRREDLEKTSKRFHLKYLLAVMNSSFAREFLRAHRRSNIHLYPDDWKQLPIPEATPAQQRPIIALVDQILAAKSTDPATDISTLETQIDTLVRRLY